MDKVILKAFELDGYLTAADKENLLTLEKLFEKALNIFPSLQKGDKNAETSLISVYNEMGAFMQDICGKIPQIHVHSFISGQENHSEASRLIAKLRNINTQNNEFIYYTQRAYEMLFKLAWGRLPTQNKNYLIVKTPVESPIQNYAVHKITNIDSKIENTVMCVMLRGALLPSMIMSKEIEEYSSTGYVTPFALFKIRRNDSKKEDDMEYILDRENSFYNPEILNDRDLIFADPMNATGGSLITVVKHLKNLKVKPRSIIFFNAISAMKGALRVVRALENCEVYTLWMDGILNKNAYIMPGLGDAGDRLNGKDSETDSRNIIRLIADYGCGITNLYRSQLREIENTVLGREK
jgi:uracil phosphoribosyltransferase